MKKLLAGLLALFCLSAQAQFTPGQLLTAQALNAQLSTKTTNTAAAITGGTISGLSAPIPIASGGTNAATASAALANLGGLPLTGGTLTGGLGAPSIGVDITLSGATPSTSVDSGAAINSCLTANSVCVVPPTSLGFYISTPVVVPNGKWLIGLVAGAQNAATGFSFSGTSWLSCANAAQNCVTWGTSGTLTSGGVRNLTITGVAGTPVSGSKGLVFAGGYNVRMENVSVANFDTCYEFDKGISGQGVNNYAQSCATHYWVFNTWPEFQQVGGRSGANGSGNYNTATDNIYYTSSIAPGGGGTGPNSIDFVNYRFENDNTTCTFRWGNYTYAPGANIGFNFTNVYKEPLPSGSSVFCSDSTVPQIQGLHMQNSYISQDTGPSDLFSGLNSATQLTDWTFDHNYFATGSATLAPTATGGAGLNYVVFTGNFLPNMTITPGGTIRSDKLVMQGDLINNTLTLNAGAHNFQQLSIIGEQLNTFTNNTDGYNQQISMPGFGLSSGLRATSTLPTCNTTTTKGMSLTVSDATSPTYGGTLTGGGSVATPVFCNGSAWVTH